MSNETVPYRHNPKQPEANPMTVRINADTEARRKKRNETARAKSVMEEAGWGEPSLITETEPEAKKEPWLRSPEQRERDNQCKVGIRERERQERIEAAALAEKADVAKQIKAAIDHYDTFRKPLPKLEWKDAPGLMTATDGKLLFSLKRKREEEWNATVVEKGEEGEPGTVLVQMTGAHKSHCEAMEYVEGLRAGWYLRASVRAKEGQG